MNTRNENNQNKIYGIIKYVAGLLGFLGILLAIFTVTGVVDWYLFQIDFKGAFTDRTKLILSLTSSILGIFFLFIAFSKQIDKFFSFLETHSIKTDKTEESKGITIESIFFLFIAVILIALALLLGTGTLVLKFAILGKATKPILIGALVVLGLFSIVTAFNQTISQSIKEMKKVHWPTGKEMIEYSKRVFTFIIFFSVLFFLLDLALTYIPIGIEKLFNIEL